MFIGRTHELDLLRDRQEDRSKAQLILIYGRRRIGKTTLIARSIEREERVLLFEGIEGAPTRVQINQFLDDLAQQTGRVRLGAKNWREVFRGLGEVIREGRWVLVFDEFPWMGVGRTRIVSELKLYWDRWSRNRELVLFLCGSVASFMSRHVVHSKALHNRKTLELCLGPLKPREAGRFIGRRSVRERAQLFMCLGGVPKYLEQADPRVSLEKNLNRLCFTAGGFFVEEYESLFKEQFRSLKVYEAIVKSLVRSPAGLSELSRRIGSARGGGLLGQVKNLVQAQFLAQYRPVSLDGRRRSRTSMFKIVDPFLIFYFRYIHTNRDLIRSNKGENLFRAIAGPTLQQYFGHAFERLGEAAFDEIRARLGLSLADIVTMGPYFQQATRTGDGLQIDWLVVRRDGVWTLIEYKYTASPVGSDVIHDVARKIERLGAPKTVTVEPILISAAGANRSVQRSAFFSRILTLEDLVG